MIGQIGWDLRRDDNVWNGSCDSRRYELGVCRVVLVYKSTWVCTYIVFFARSKSLKATKYSVVILNPQFLAVKSRLRFVCHDEAKSWDTHQSLSSISVIKQLNKNKSNCEDNMIVHFLSGPYYEQSTEAEAHARSRSPHRSPNNDLIANQQNYHTLHFRPHTVPLYIRYPFA
jgi:hypothetical protein